MLFFSVSVFPCVCVWCFCVAAFFVFLRFLCFCLSVLCVSICFVREFGQVACGAWGLGGHRGAASREKCHLDGLGAVWQPEMVVPSE